MIKLRNKENGEVLGSISEDELKFLRKHLVEESPDDTDYFLNRDELEVLRENNGSEHLLSLLEKGFGEKGELEIEWGED